MEVGVNPKINNMQPGYLAAKHELVLVSDSGLLMKEDTLTDMVAHMTPDVGIVHQMPFTCDRKGWPAILEKVSVVGGRGPGIGMHVYVHVFVLTRNSRVVLPVKEACGDVLVQHAGSNIGK